MKTKEIILIRHAQSNENVKFQGFCEGINRIKKLKAPKISHVTNSLNLFKCDLDSELSPLGKQQVSDMNHILNENNFWLSFAPELIVHSPLLRAFDTIRGLLPSTISTPVVESTLLREANPIEYIISSTLHSRIDRFCNWLMHQSAKRVVICGHSQYFRRMLRTKDLMQNCDVWKVEFAYDRLNHSFSWNCCALLYRTMLSTRHPWSKVPELNMSSTFENSPEPDISPNNLSSELSFCRICQMTCEENTEKLIRPCLCSGSLAHVHIKCLNRWRMTSENASKTCSVCGFEYVIIPNPWLSFILSTYGKILLSTLVVLLILLIGSIFGLCIVPLFSRFLLSSSSPMYSKDIVEIFHLQFQFQQYWKYSPPFLASSKSWKRFLYPYTKLIGLLYWLEAIILSDAIAYHVILGIVYPTISMTKFLEIFTIIMSIYQPHNSSFHISCMIIFSSCGIVQSIPVLVQLLSERIHPLFNDTVTEINKL